MRIYDDLAEWYPLITAADEYEQEAAHLCAVIAQSLPGASSLLELGAGAGHMASHLKARFACTLTDVSPSMLDLSRALNPDCAHVEADMRSLRLGRRFEAVLAHDAIGYMTTQADLLSVFETAAAHLEPGGVAIFVPDFVSDTFEPTTMTGGRDAANGRGLRYLEWSHDPDPTDTTIDVDFALMIREPGKSLRVEHDSHREGLFDRSTWRRLMARAGLEPVMVAIPDPYEGAHEVFVARRSR